MHVLLVAIGSSGDVHPLVGVGLELARRGHRITIVTSLHFEPLVRALGWGYVPLGTAEDYDRITSDPNLSHPRKGTELVIEHCCARWVRDVYRIVEEHHAGGDLLVVSGGLGLGARIAHEKLGVPLVTTHVQPLMFRSVHQAPKYGWLPLPSWTPRAVRSAIYRAIDLYADRLITPVVNPFRAELGLRPVNRVFHHWWMSPQRVIGLFPEWFGPPQPDWPSQTRVTGFPMYDENGAVDIPDEVDAFLGAGEPPIVFTPGTAMRHGLAFFEVSVAACRQLGRRGLLLTKFREQVPADLPESVRHFDYVPLSAVLPRAAAMVHHGGMGTLAQTLQAGIPHLVMPMVNDQPDNAARLLRLGVADAIAPSAYRLPAVTKSLDRLLNGGDVRVNCRRLAQTFEDVDARALASDEIEALAAEVL